MLENMRRQGASIFVYLIFCLLIAIFVINFRPGQSRQDGGGCSGTTNVVVSVDGSDATQTAYHVAYANPYNRGSGKQKVYVALETLIRRELLAQEAEAHGLLATDDLVMDEIKKGHFYLGGQRTQIPGIMDEDGLWKINVFRNWVGQMNVSKNAYIEEQKHSLLASMMSELLSDSVQVSRDEALAHFLFENNTVTYDVVAFKPEEYRAALRLTDADVDRFVAGHEDDVKARYKADERTYKAVKPQLQLRQIFIAKLEPPKPDDKKPDDKKPDGKKPDDKKPDDKKPEVKPVGMSIDEAKAKLEAARAAIAAGKQKFADAARELSTDAAAKASGGDLGWHTADNPMLGEKAVSDAVKTLKPGELTPVIATDRGAYLITVENKREGDLSYDQVKHEIGQQLARDTWGKEAAKRAAIAALDKARAGTAQNLDQLYERNKTPEGPDMNIEKLLNDPSIPEDQKKQILEMLMKQSQKHGALEVQSQDIPAAWYADAGGTGGSGSAAAAIPAVPPPPAVDPTVPSNDQLPSLGDVEKPKLDRNGPAPRGKSMPGVGASKEAQAALFEELTPGMLAKRIYEADGAFVVMQLIGREQPKVADFDKDADRRVAELRKGRAQAFVEDWLKDRCEKLYKDGKIKPNPELIQERDDQGKPLPVQYRPCMSFH